MSTFDEPKHPRETSGKFAVKERAEAQLSLTSAAGTLNAPQAPVGPPPLTTTQRDALRALAETGRQWPSGRGRWSGGLSTTSGRFSSRAFDTLVEAGAARRVVPKPSSGVLPYYEPTITASHDPSTGTWYVKAPNAVADEAYAAAVVHGRRRAAHGDTLLNAYAPEKLRVERCGSVGNVTTFKVHVMPGNGTAGR